MQRDDLEGRWSFTQFVLRTGAMTREDFLREFRAPLLVQYTEPGDGESSFPSSYGTLSISRAAAARAVRPLRVQALVKRSGNPFTAMITVGSAFNNDIVLPYEEISKFHAFFLEGPSGWSVADAGSMNGTWLSGVRLEANKPYTIRFDDSSGSGATLTFSGVSMGIHSPEQLYDIAGTMAASGVA
jgi:hypothetical protein